MRNPMDIKFIKNGDVITTSENKVLKTELGSCVSICLWDPIKKIAGMNHYLLPGDNNNRNKPFEYGEYANHALVKEMIRQGAKVKQLKAYVFGGATLHPNYDHLKIGEKNVKVALEILVFYGIKVSGQYTGGYLGRSIYFYNFEGYIKLREIDMENSRSNTQKLLL